MIIRGICCIRPGVLLKTENIQVTSIVGRYLEHARIYVFGRGDQAKYFIASADLMTRNLQRRVEIACPIWDREIQEQLRYILDLQLQDNAKASFLQPSGAYLRKEIRTVLVDSQEELMRVSLHRPEQAPTVSEKPSALHRLLGRLFGKIPPSPTAFENAPSHQDGGRFHSFLFCLRRLRTGAGLQRRLRRADGAGKKPILFQDE